MIAYVYAYPLCNRQSVANLCSLATIPNRFRQCAGSAGDHSFRSLKGFE
jgi:hypothetical protein